MKTTINKFDWPLLGKELIEQAARRQTYVVRVIYAVLLFGGFGFYYEYSLPDMQTGILGHGLKIFQFLVTLQAIAIVIFLPPLMASAIAQEKERDSLQLLFLTDLDPWELLWQKYVGRLIPMLTFLLLGLPLMAVAYSLGGVSFSMLCSAIGLLFLSCLQVGALALMYSSYSATTFQALVRFYTSGLLLLWIFGVTPMPPRSSSAFGAVVAVLSILAFLHKARVYLYERAFVERSNPFNKQFKSLDQFWRDSRKLVRGILRAGDQESYTDAAQLLKGRRKTFAASRQEFFEHLMYRLQVPGLLAGAIIIGAITVILVAAGIMLDSLASHVVPFLVFSLWAIALLTVPIQSANVIASERMNQRLDVLLTTPLSADEIIRQRTIAVRRWSRFLRWPLFTMVLLGAWGRFASASNRPEKIAVLLYLASSILAVLIYLPLMQWLGLFIGLRLRNQVRALLAASVGILLWCFLPWLVFVFLKANVYLGDFGYFTLLSPVTIVQLAEMSKWKDSFVHPWFAVAANFCVYGGLLFGVRYLCLKKADQYLGRA